MSHDKIASGNVFYFYTVFYEKITVQGYKLVINSDSQHIKDILRILLMICRTMAWDLLIRNTQRLLNLVQEQDKALAVTLSVLVRALKVKSVIWLMVRYRADSHWTGALVLISALLLYQVQLRRGAASTGTHWTATSLLVQWKSHSKSVTNSTYTSLHGTREMLSNKAVYNHFKLMNFKIRYWHGCLRHCVVCCGSTWLTSCTR